MRPVSHCDSVWRGTGGQPLIVTQSPDMRVIQLGIASFAGEHSTQWQLIMAGSTVAAIPGLILYVFLQNFLIEGIKMTGLK